MRNERFGGEGRARRLTRWRVEDTIGHVKRSYNLEDIRLFKYGKLKNMVALVLAAVYFSMAWIGNTEKHDVIARSVARMSLRIHGVPEFHFYSIADGTRDVLKRGRPWHERNRPAGDNDRQTDFMEKLQLDSS